MNKIVDAYSRLVAIKNIPEGPQFSQLRKAYVVEYHEVVSLLEEETGVDLSQFRVPNSEIKPRVTGGSNV